MLDQRYLSTYPFLPLVLEMKEASVKYFFDTEFIEDGSTIDLISIGIVAEDGREYYAINRNCDFSRANTWVQDNVIQKLDHPAKGSWKPRRLIAQEVQEFVSEKPQFWGYYADYDWVVLCQLYGTMMQLPKGWPMYCMDLKQFCVTLGDPKLPDQGKGEHNALDDARWNYMAYNWLVTYQNQLATDFRSVVAGSTKL